VAGISNVELAFRRLLRGPEANRWGIRAEVIRLASETAYWQVRAFYLVAFLAAFDFLRRAYLLSLSDSDVALLWPVFWVDWVGLESAGQAIGLFLVVACFAALWRPGFRWPRILVFLGFLQFTALDNSFGSINHYGHYLIWISFIFIFAQTAAAPAHGSSLSRHHAFLLPVFFAQCLIGLFYSLSGFHKIMGGLRWSPDYVSSFHPDALPLLIMGRWDQTGVSPMFAEFFAQYTAIAWPAYLLVIYFETTFLLAVFRPQLHRFYGFVLASFHIGVWLTMGISFPYQPVLVALLFIWSPLAHFDRATFSQRVAQMPLIDVAISVSRYVNHRHSIERFASTKCKGKLADPPRGQ
jgi:hypothetical protein